MSFPKYPAYKPSGVEWLGEVPAHWEVKRLKCVLQRNDGGVWGNDPSGDGDTIVLRSTEQTADGKWQLDEPALRKLTDAEKCGSLLAAGDLLVTKSSGSSLHIGKTTLVTQQIEAMECCYSNFMQRLRLTDELNSKLAWYFMNSEISRVQFDFLSNSTTGLANLNGALLGELTSPIPSEREQGAITQFLDRETAKIDALIAEQEQLITLLKEKRQAVISHAVTKGLDASAPMKDSGVAWLGEVPAHWQIKALKFVATVQTGIAKGKDNAGKATIMVPYLRVANVQDGYLDLEDVAEIEIPEADLPRYLLQDGDVLMNEGGDFDKLGRGHVWRSEISPCVHQNHVFSVRPHSVSSEWLNKVTSSEYAQFYFMSRSKQSTNLASISSSSLMDLPVVLPPEAEQNHLIVHIQQTTEQLSNLLAEAAQSIDLLRERRSALIAAAVTGQIDVREAA